MGLTGCSPRRRLMSQPLHEGLQLPTTIFAASVATVVTTIVTAHTAERSGSVGSVAVPFGGRWRFPLVARALAALGGISPGPQSYDGRGSETTSSEDEGKSVLRFESVGDQRCC